MGLDWADVVSRWHPLVLHLPVALCVILFLLELPRWIGRKRPDPDPTRRLLVRLLVLSAPLAALSGWLLHEGGGYGDEVEWHEYLGFALCANSLWIGYAYRRRPGQYPWAVCLAFLIMIPTAHFGGSLTHGEDFLTGPWRTPEALQPGPAASVAQVAGLAAEAPAPLSLQESGSAGGAVVGSPGVAPSVAPVGDSVEVKLAEQPDLQRAPSYGDVQSIFQSYCVKCHGTRKRKAGLNLASLESILAGGESGACLLPGDPGQSSLLQRMLLPLEHEDHMPPSTKSQPNAAELLLVERWIRSLNQEAMSEELARPTLPQVLEPTPPVAQVAAQAVPVNAESKLALQRLRERLVHMERLQPGEPGLWLDFEACELEGGQLAGLLQGLEQRVVRLSLSGKALLPDDLQTLANLPNLESLELTRHTGEPLDLGPLERLVKLRVLNLTGSRVVEDTRQVLESMESLERVYLSNTGLDETPLAKLSRSRPELIVEGSNPSPDAALEVEPEVVFSTPVEEPSEPVEEVSEPVEEPSALAEESSVEASEPAEEPSTPGEEPSEPSAEPSAPVED